MMPATVAGRNQIVIGLQQAAKATKGKLTIFGEDFDPAAQLSDAGTLATDDKSHPKIVKNSSKSSLPVICPSNLSSLLFSRLLHLSKSHEITSETGQPFATTKRLGMLSIKSLLLCVLRKLLNVNAKWMQNKLESTEHDAEQPRRALVNGYDDDTALDCFELGQALQDLESADLDGEHNFIAPFVREDSPDTRNGMEVDGSDAEVIDVDSLDLE